MITEDAAVCYIAYEVCYACYGIHGAKRPPCAAGDVIFQTVVPDCGRVAPICRH